MALIRWEPFRDFDKWFQDDLMTSAQDVIGIGRDLACDLYEEDGNLVVEMQLSGIDPEKVDISVSDDGNLRVTGEREEELETEEKNYYHKEIRRGSFDRVIPLPSAVDITKTTASAENGVLKIVLPKKTDKKGKKVKVEVKKSKK